MYKIIGLMACDPRGVIGKGSGLPWHNPDETAHFRKIVAGQVVIMGHKTLATFPESDCLKIIFSRHKPKAMGEDIIFVSSVEELNALALPQDKKIFMIGGAEIAHLFLQHSLIAEFILTKMKKNYDGDVILDLNFLQNWSSSVVIDHKDYTIYRLIKGELS